MKASFFVNENQLQDWIEAAENIKEGFSVEKALGYVIGEKFYSVLRAADSYRDTLKEIEEEKCQPNYNPIRIYSLGKHGESREKRDETYEKTKERVSQEEGILEEFVRLVEGTFARHEIEAYFNSHPRLGSMGHIVSEEEHAFMVEKGMVERTVETEAEDALLFDRIKKHFNRC